eukprot:GHVT01088403.1.p1 GENE.GHVT01088403.1~~GHVT01088403.1.p1  ORF type:complete len:128 (-),score=22.47 GHVT01088403.1:711-1094(-)
MSSMMGGFAAKRLDREISSGVASTVASFSSSFGIQQPQGGQPAQNAIEWTNFNYPPLLRIFHYDPSELPTPVTRVCHALHGAAILAAVTLILNFIDNIVIGIGGAPKIWILYSLLNFIIVVPFALYG